MNDDERQGWSRVVDQLGGTSEQRRRAERRLAYAASEDDAVAAALIAGLDSTDKNVRAGAARLAGSISLDDAGKRLLELASDSHQPGRVRKSVTLALASLAVPEEALVEALTPLTRHDDPMYRRAAVETLGRRRARAALALLIGALADDAWQVRMFAAIGLGQLPASGAALAALGRARRVEAHGATAEQILRTVADLGSDPRLRARAIAVLCAELDDHLSQKWARRHHVARLEASVRGLGELGAQGARQRLTAMEKTAVGGLAHEVRWALCRLQEAEEVV